MTLLVIDFAVPCPSTAEHLLASSNRDE
eukprot:SAG31_NODE_26845_length_435_cov_1.113095_1_plen_27_part_01